MAVVAIQSEFICRPFEGGWIFIDDVYQAIGSREWDDPALLALVRALR